MGLMPYGNDRFVDVVMKSITLLPEGNFEIQIDGPNGLVQTLKIKRPGKSTLRAIQVDACIAFAGQVGLEAVLKHCLDYL
jgi:hypothetical protein